MKSENERLILNERATDDIQVSNPAETMRRCRSMNELPGHHRVTVLRRGDTERTRARLEAVAAGMVELKHLREKHQQMMEEALCDTSRKQLGQRSEVRGQGSEVEERPKRRHQNSARSTDAAHGKYPSHGVDGKKSRQRVKQSGDGQSQEEMSRQNIAQHSRRYKGDVTRPNVIPREMPGQPDAIAQEDRRRRHQESQDCPGGPRTKPQEDPKQIPRQERTPGQRHTRDPNDRRQQNHEPQGGSRPRDANLQGEPQSANHQGVYRQHNVHREYLDSGVNRQEVNIADKRMQNQVRSSSGVLRSRDVKQPAYYGLSSHRSTPHNLQVHLATDPKSSQHGTYTSSKTSHGATSGGGSGQSACSDNSGVISYSGSPVRSTNQNSHKFENRGVKSENPWRGGADIATPSPAYNDNELRHCLVLTQSDQRFSRGRTQSVHENFYYFPTRGDSGKQNIHNSETTEKYNNNQPLPMNERNANSRPQNNFQTGHNNTDKKQIVSSVESSKRASTQQSKSISWDELLVSVGLGKNIFHNDYAKNVDTKSYANKSFDSQTIITDALERKLSPKSDENSDEYGERKTNVSQKPYRSQSFSGLQPSVYYSNVTRCYDMNKRQKIDDSVPQNNAIIKSISRHPSLSTVSTKIFNPLHEVDIRCMNRPGPVHAVTLQYAGLTTRHMSLGSIPSVSGLSTKAPQGSSTEKLASAAGSARLSDESRPISKQRNEFDSRASQKHPGYDRDADYNGIFKEKSTTPLQTHLTYESLTSPNVDNRRLNASTTNEAATPGFSPATFNRPHSSTSIPSPKYSPINTIVEDVEDVFEFPVEPITSSIKPRSLSDTWDKSKPITWDAVSTRGRSMTTTTPTREKSTESADILNSVESHGSMLLKEGTVTPNSLKIETPLSTSPHPVPGLFPLKMSDVALVVDEGYITCDSASVRPKMHKMAAPTTSVENSSVSSGSLGSVSANGDTPVCVQNNFQGSQRNRSANLRNDSKICNYKDSESSDRVRNDLSLEIFDVNTNSARTIPPVSEATVELPSAHCHQNLRKNDEGGLTTDVGENKDAPDTAHVHIPSLKGDIKARDTSAVSQTLPDDQPTCPKTKQPFKQTAL